MHPWHENQNRSWTTRDDEDGSLYLVVEFLIAVTVWLLLLRPCLNQSVNMKGFFLNLLSKVKNQILASVKGHIQGVASIDR